MTDQPVLSLRDPNSSESSSSSENSPTGTPLARAPVIDKLIAQWRDRSDDLKGRKDANLVDQASAVVFKTCADELEAFLGFSERTVAYANHLLADKQLAALRVLGGARETASLFRLGQHTLHSGEQSLWKIECDALTDADIETLALMLRTVLPAFGSVEGVPRGGLRIAEALRGYSTKGPLLIVDDVTTTGDSLEQQRAGREAIGAVLFARQACHGWVTPLFQMPVLTGRVLGGAQTGAEDDTHEDFKARVDSQPLQSIAPVPQPPTK